MYLLSSFSVFGKFKKEYIFMKISELLLNMILNEMEGSISLPPLPQKTCGNRGGLEIEYLNNQNIIILLFIK